MDKVLFFEIYTGNEKHTPTRKEWTGLIAARREHEGSLSLDEYEILEEYLMTREKELENRMDLWFQREYPFPNYEVRFFSSQGIFSVSVGRDKWLKDAISQFTGTEFFPEGGEIIPLGMHLFHSKWRVGDVVGILDETPPLERFLQREEAWYRIGDWLHTVTEATCRLKNSGGDPRFYYADLIARAWKGLEVGDDFDPGYADELCRRALFDLIYGSLSEELSHMGGFAPRITKRQFAEIWAMITRYRLE